MPWLLLESQDGPGGRVRTDYVDGFQLDRGFQVLLTAYPEAQATLDYDALDLRAFEPGALVRVPGGFRRVSDPLRRPTRALATLRAPIGGLGDKVRVDIGKRRADILVPEKELAERKAAWKPHVKESQTPWQEIQRGIVDQVDNGMVLKPAVKYRDVAHT